MTNAELIAEARALDAAANTQEPWETVKSDVGRDVMSGERYVCTVTMAQDAALIARYRTLALELAERLETAATRNDQWVEVVDGFRGRQLELEQSLASAKRAVEAARSAPYDEHLIRALDEHDKAVKP
jgi:uncharacterized NAD(P)/FAD-binding protein YdhS